MRIGDREREENPSRDALVGTCLAEYLAVQYVLARRNLDAHHACRNGQSVQQKKKRKESDEQPHARKDTMHDCVAAYAFVRGQALQCLCSTGMAAHRSASPARGRTKASVSTQPRNDNGRVVNRLANAAASVGAHPS